MIVTVRVITRQTNDGPERWPETNAPWWQRVEDRGDEMDIEILTEFLD